MWRSDASGFLDVDEETLEQIAAIADVPFERARVSSVEARRYRGATAACRIGSDDFRVVALVGG